MIFFCCFRSSSSSFSISTSCTVFHWLWTTEICRIKDVVSPSMTCWPNLLPTDLALDDADQHQAGHRHARHLPQVPPLLVYRGVWLHLLLGCCRNTWDRPAQVRIRLEQARHRPGGDLGIVQALLAWNTADIRSRLSQTVHQVNDYQPSGGRRARHHLYNTTEKRTRPKQSLSFKMADKVWKGV